MTKNVIVRLRFTLLRAVERVLPVDVLYWVLRPFALLHAAFQRTPEPLALPPCFAPAKIAVRTRRQLADGYMNAKVEYFPDRMNTPRWASRWRVEGLPHLEQARREGRAIVFAPCHVGPIMLIRTVARAAGIAASALVRGEVASRSTLNKMINRVMPFPEVPCGFYMDQLREVSRFLAEKNALFIVVDQRTGKQMEAPLEDGWTFEMATGAIRLAARHDALLIPCCIVDEGRWRFCLHLGRPVPQEFLASEAGWARAGRHLIEEMLPVYRRYPEQCAKQMILRFNPPNAVRERRAPETRGVGLLKPSAAK